jgi:acyl-CoA thioesterase-1
MTCADSKSYLLSITSELIRAWPNNRIINIVCHGHSVPAGYFRTPVVDTLGAYPHQVLEGLKERYPNAVINVIVTAIGGEHSEAGNSRFEKEVLSHQPDVVVIDYATNDRGIGLERSEKAWIAMIKAAKNRGCKLILLTSIPDLNSYSKEHIEHESRRRDHCDLVRRLARDEELALADSDLSYGKYLGQGGNILDLLSQGNHPNRKGHAIIAQDIIRWFHGP